MSRRRVIAVRRGSPAAMAELCRLVLRDADARLPGGFWAALAVWLERPQVANRRLSGARLDARRSAVLPHSSDPWSRTGADDTHPEGDSDPWSWAGADDNPPEGDSDPGLRVSAASLSQGHGEAGGRAALDRLWARLCGGLAGGPPGVLDFLRSPATQPATPLQLHLLLRTVIPKAGAAAPGRELVVQDVPNRAVTFLPLEEDSEGAFKVKTGNVYQIRLSQYQGEWFMSVLLFCPEKWHSDGVLCPKPAWLAETLLPRLARWSVETKASGFPNTLSLVSVAEYSRTYQRLKEKHKELVKAWPEVTDPEKFVYEDVAIASYLLVLWEAERTQRGDETKQSFVDLGCGNGLLVHILSSEGHPGRGIDVRRRRIWDLFSPQTRLEEAAITPSDDTLFPEADWVLGNHSDELTPWIPVIAARSSYTCRFFLLPCCFFDFSGRFQRRHVGRTQYREYLDFVLDVGEVCGFHVQEDCLRIPSTKRVCLVGSSRTYPPSEEPTVDKRRTCYIQSRQPHPTKLPDAQGPTELVVDEGPCAPWLAAFRPRERTERVRNCASLPRALIEGVVLHVARLLLGTPGLGPLLQGDSQAWNPGGSLTLAEVAASLDRETLQGLKRECGGLQTLLRNKHQVFRVVGGQVRLRDWREESGSVLEAKRGSSATTTFKTRPCWFFAHHPHGCPLPAPACPFAHGPSELRPRRTPL